MSFVRRHPLLAFFVLTYLFTWSLVPFGSFLPAGPLLASVVVIALSEGRPGLRRWWSRLIRWRVSWVWYLVAIGVPLAVHALTIASNVALGAGRPVLDQLSPVSGVLLVFAVRLVNPLDGPAGEEPGWRGYAQPGLQQRWTPFRSTLVLALLVSLWHLPLWLLPAFGATPSDIISGSVGSFAVTFWYAWLLNRTGGSVLLTLVAHAVEGSLQVSQYWPTAPARTALIYTAVWCLVAAVLVLADRNLWWPPRADASGSGAQVSSPRSDRSILATDVLR